RGAVLGRHGLHIGGELVAAGARHVLRHDYRVAGDVAAEFAREQPRISVVAAARRAADVEVDLPAAVELRDGILLAVRRVGKPERENGAGGNDAGTVNPSWQVCVSSHAGLFRE